MKVIIQIPCLNEEESLPITLAALPRELEGVDTVEWLIIDDGSTDRTVEVALANGVDHVIRNPVNQGLAKTFMTGLKACMERGADIIVNTDADNQYEADDIPLLLAPILKGEALMTIGARPIQQTEHFSPIKKLLQRLGSWTVRKASGTDIADAPSGFRAIHREAAIQLNVFNAYTYTLETIIQAGRRDIRLVSVPIRTNEDMRPSRLVKSIRSYVQRSIGTILRIFLIYRPGPFFATIGLIPFTVGGALMMRWMYYFIIGSERTRLPSLVLAAVLVTAGIQILLFALLADSQSVNRKLLEDIQIRGRRLELENGRDVVRADVDKKSASEKA